MGNTFKIVGFERKDFDYGTSSSGYHKHIRINIFLSNGDVLRSFFKYSSRGYATYDGNLSNYGLNGRRLEKHLQYDDAVEKHFNRLVNYVNNNLVDKVEYKNMRELNRELRTLKDKI